MRLKEILQTWKEARQIAAEKRRIEGLAAAKLQAALHFNNLHAYHHKGRQEWMCPFCNRIHPRLQEISVLTGYQYPACCDFPEGHKQYKSHGYERNHPCLP
ncbi:hypothetical protein [Stenotrophomonas pictorum]|uniref:hypothetical protein n=1 Tax=Stenotrophomonas pictorum TaxID=86184 RepID=UPI000AF849C1|nr:hypothetical protein [Stenotrophomonas pictorum]